jgi:hypothetical protein
VHAAPDRDLEWRVVGDGTKPVCELVVPLKGGHLLGSAAVIGGVVQDGTVDSKQVCHDYVSVL